MISENMSNISFILDSNRSGGVGLYSKLAFIIPNHIQLKQSEGEDLERKCLYAQVL